MAGPCSRDFWIGLPVAYWIAIGVFGGDINEQHPDWSYPDVTALAIFWPYWVALRLSPYGKPSAGRKTTKSKVLRKLAPQPAERTLPVCL
jgi:hypothetical protein